MPATLKQGSLGPDVETLQTCLNNHGHAVDTDGAFGPGTHAAVLQFQASRNLTTDGIVGPKTWKYLQKESGVWPKDDGTEEQKLLAKIPKGIPVDRRRVLESAIKDLGADEIPDGSNWGDEILHLVDGYNEYWGISTAQYGHMAWCAMSCGTWIGIGLGLGTRSSQMDWDNHPFEKYLGGAQQIEDWGKKTKCWVEETEEALPAAVFSMPRGTSGSDAAQTARAGHVGLVVCDNGNGTITTIEGNVSNGVRSYIRKKAGLKGFVEWWRA